MPSQLSLEGDFSHQWNKDWDSDKTLDLAAIKYIKIQPLSSDFEQNKIDATVEMAVDPALVTVRIGFKTDPQWQSGTPFNFSDEARARRFANELVDAAHLCGHGSISWVSNSVALAASSSNERATAEISTDSLQSIMTFIAELIEQNSRVSYARLDEYGGAIAGKPAQMMEQISDLHADICALRYKQGEWLDGRERLKFRDYVDLMHVGAVWVSPYEMYLNQLLNKDGKSTIRIAPSLTVAVAHDPALPSTPDSFVPNLPSNEFVFSNADTAVQFAKALIHAAQLCDSGNVSLNVIEPAQPATVAANSSIPVPSAVQLAQNSSGGAAVAELTPSSAAAIVASLRAPADQPFPDRLKEELRHADKWYSLIEDSADVCDGRKQADGHWIESRAHACNTVAGGLFDANDFAGFIAYNLKACRIGLDAGDPNGSSACMLVTNNARLGLSTSAKRAIWFDCHTTRCLGALADSLWLEDPKDEAAAGIYAKQACNEASPEGSGRSIRGACELAQRLGSMQDISGGLAQAQQQNEDYHQQIANKNDENRQRMAAFDREMANNAAAVNAITHNGNLIAETANQQTARILSMGGVRTSALPQIAAPQPNTSSTGSYSGNSSNVASLQGSNSYGQSSSQYQYASPISAGCVSQFWDSSQYGWLSFQNNCGEPIHLQFVASNNTGVFGGSGGSADLSPGGTKNIGQSPAEVNTAGGYSLYICPGGYLAVDNTGQTVQGPNQTFRCRKQ